MTKAGRIDLSIIIPTLQEARRIEHTLDKLAAHLDSHDYGQVEVIVVVGESPDGTAKLAQAKSLLFKNFRVVHSGPAAGKGRDVRTGMFEAVGRYRLFMDADLATPLHHLSAVKTFMKAGGQIGIGSRKLSSIHTGLRRVISEGINLLVRVVLLPGIRDTQCGFKVFEAKVAEDVFARQYILKWLFDIEILVISRQIGYTVTQFKLDDWEDMPNGTFHGRIWADAIHTIRDLSLITWRRATGKYKDKWYKYEPHGAA